VDVGLRWIVSFMRRRGGKKDSSKKLNIRRIFYIFS
jgi:hypothetical protein